VVAVETFVAQWEGLELLQFLAYLRGIETSLALAVQL